MDAKRFLVIMLVFWAIIFFALITSFVFSSTILRSRLADRTCIIISNIAFLICLICLVLSFLVIFLAEREEGKRAYKGYLGGSSLGTSERRPATMWEMTHGIHYNYEGWENDTARCSDDEAEARWNLEHRK